MAIPTAPPVTLSRSRALNADIYGFVYWIVSAVTYVLFVLWAYVPERTLHSYGITYYPSKYWATAVPVWCCLAIGFALVAYESLNMLDVPALWSMKTITDARAKSPLEPPTHAMRSVPALADMPLPAVCEMVYMAPHHQHPPDD